MNLENAYSVCILVRERIKQAVVNDSEDDGRCANPESEGKGGDECETAVLAKTAEGEAKIAEEIVEVDFPSRLARSRASSGVMPSPM
jgi:hypothetical protein